jgi:hypothetical protein
MSTLQQSTRPRREVVRAEAHHNDWAITAIPLVSHVQDLAASRHSGLVRTIIRGSCIAVLGALGLIVSYVAGMGPLVAAGVVGAALLGLIGGPLAAVVAMFSAIALYAGMFRLFKRSALLKSSPAHTEESSPGSQNSEVARGVRSQWGGLLELGIYTAVALVLLWPATSSLGSTIAGTRDANYYLWQGWWLGEHINWGNILPLNIPDVVYPYGSDLRLMDGLFPSYVGGLWNLVANPFLAYNLSLATATLLNLWAGGRIGRLFSARRGVWILTGVAFATAPVVALRMYEHYTLYFMFPVALLITESVRIVRGQRVRPFMMGLLLALAYLCSIYQLVFGGLALSTFVFAGLWRTARLRGTIVRTVSAGVIAAILISPFLVARLNHDRRETAQGAPQTLLGDAHVFSADGLSIVAQPSNSLVKAPATPSLPSGYDQNLVEATIFPGFALLLGIGILLFLKTSLKRPVLITTASIWLFSLGPSLRFVGSFVLGSHDGAPVTWMPYAALMSIPGLGSLRTPNRAGFALAAVLVCAFAIALSWIVSQIHSSAGRSAVYAACGLLLVMNLVIPAPTSDLETTATTHTGLREVAARANPNDSTLFVPSDCTSETISNIKLQILFRAPAVGCQASFAAIPWYSELDIYAESEGLAALRCDQSQVGRRPTRFRDETLTASRLEELQSELDVRFVVVDKALLELPVCEEVEETVSAQIRNHENLGEDGRWAVFDLNSSPLEPGS